VKTKPEFYRAIRQLGLILGFVLALPAGAEGPSVLVKTAPVQEKTLTETLMAFGVLDPDPDQVLSLSLPHAGLINRVWVRLGQRVKSGDGLLEVITAPDARMQYLQAQSAVDYAQRELERQQRLLDEQLATRAQLDASRKNLQDARSTLESLHQRGMDVTRETLRAPMDGIVTRLDVSQGQRVQADTTAILIAAEKQLIARLGIEPEDLGTVQPGTPVQITSVFGRDVQVETTIREVHAMIDPDTHLVEVLASIPEQQVNQLVLGSRVLGRVQLASRTALVVPRSAVLGGESEASLYIVADGKARRVPVRTGIEEDDLIEVTGAMKAGDVVVVSGNYELTDGMTVRVSP
jgi:RND family efflux transporter MFP subunit